MKISEAGILRSTKSLDEAFDGYAGFREVGIQIFSSEDLTDKLLRTFVGLAANGWQGTGPKEGTLHAIGSLYLNGLWLPCTPRVVLAGQIDGRNDGYPAYAAMPFFEPNDDQLYFHTAKKVQSLPKGWAAIPGHNAVYEATLFVEEAARNRFDKRIGKGSGALEVYRDFCTVNRDRIIACKLTRSYKGYDILGSALTAFQVAAVLSVVSDFTHLWNVETWERPLGDKWPTETPIRLGVDANMVKSLFYARDLPVSESGRKRPILHWVRAHERRLRQGVDIDVTKHLRGITEFEMDGFPFRITQPVKSVAREAI